MQSPAQPIHTELVLIGGGHSHAIALKMFGNMAGMGKMAGVRLTLISEASDTPYSGMLPGYVAGIYEREQCHIDLRRLTGLAGAQFYVDRVVGLDLANQQILCQNRPPVAFDYLSLDIGSTPKVAAINPEFSKYSIAVKPIPHFLGQWQSFLTEICQESPEQLSVAIAGGGVGGVELAIAIQQRLSLLLPQTKLTLHLLHRRKSILSGHNAYVQREIGKELNRREIICHLQEQVLGLEGRNLICESGLTLPCDRLFWVTQAQAPDWIKASGLAVDQQGFVAIQNTLQSISHPHILATGDIASNLQYPRPKAGVFAVRQGKPLFENLQALVAGKPLLSYIPQSQILSLIGTADGRAIASKGFFAWRSKLMWWWKDRIDRQFMQQFQDLPIRHEKTPNLSLPKPMSEPMYCAGCGSKVGSATLSAVLARLPQPKAEGVLVGLANADDAAVIQVPTGQVLVQTIDYFRAFLPDPYLCGQITAHHCLSDLFAMAADPHSALAIATIPHGTSKAQAETLYQILAGATEVLNQAGSTLVGGHTTEGTELIFGLSCNGFAEPNRFLRKRGMQIGDVLILTKALGTGTILAAEMQRQAKASWLDGAIASMLNSNSHAAKILQQYQCHACTDITGFGLVGHLREMVEASQVQIQLDLSQIPILDGAIATVEMGILSSLHSQNLQAQSIISNLNPKIESLPIYSLLFDPQTSGGLLAAMPQHQAIACLEALQTQGYKDSAAIGCVIEIEPETLPSVMLSG